MACISSKTHKKNEAVGAPNTKAVALITKVKEAWEDWGHIMANCWYSSGFVYLVSSVTTQFMSKACGSLPWHQCVGIRHRKRIPFWTSGKKVSLKLFVCWVTICSLTLFLPAFRFPVVQDLFQATSQPAMLFSFWLVFQPGAAEAAWYDPQWWWWWYEDHWAAKL